MSPDRCVLVAVAAYRDRNAEAIVVEENLGGNMVGLLIHALDPTASYRGVRATQPKLNRAAPIASL